VLRLQTFGLGESSAQQLIRDRIRTGRRRSPLSFRAGAPQLEIKLSVDETEAPADCAITAARCLEALFGDHILGEGDTRIAGARASSWPASRVSHSPAPNPAPAA
jgi:nicotinamide-nucleotide amidase